MLAETLPSCPYCQIHNYDSGGGMLASPMSTSWFTTKCCERGVCILSYHRATYMLVADTKADMDKVIEWANETLLVTIRHWWTKREKLQNQAWHDFLHGENGFLGRHGVEEVDTDCISYHDLPTQAAKDDCDAHSNAWRYTDEPYPAELQSAPYPPKMPENCHILICRGTTTADEWEAAEFHRSQDETVPRDPILVRHEEFFGGVFAKLGIAEREEIPNRYCGSKNEPWYAFTVGNKQFTVGPRKRVTSIRVVLPLSANIDAIADIAKQDDVTYSAEEHKGSQRVLIHAWTKEKLLEYMRLLLAA